MIATSSDESRLFKDSNIKFILTNRLSGFSENGFESLNLGNNTNDSLVESNKFLLKSHLKTNKIHFINQIHSNKILTLQSTSNELLGDGDGIFCANKGQFAMVCVADCNPILLYSKAKNCFTLLHAGRAGLEQKIIQKACELIDSSDIIAFVGASIRECCYEIDGELLEFYKKEYSDFLVAKGSRFHLDMIAMIKSEFRNFGIKNFEIYPKCTCCRKEFFSYRRDKNCGRFALICALKK
ncbi:MAG: polyphenol oxidase family protein [Helicobacteraceae bacterium]|nr:polyphenol oxidase family protein [Helicobacteraceae bacterium]